MPVLMKLLSQVGPGGPKHLHVQELNYGRVTGIRLQMKEVIPATVKIMKQVADEGGFKIDVATYP